MAKSILDIIIRTVKQGGGDKETVKGLVAVKGAVTTALTAFGAFAGVAYTVDKALDATVGKYVTYAQNVRDAKLALGLSADETSRVIALTDDLGISYDELSASIKKNADNTNFSIEGLAAASAEYLALESASDRAKFAQKEYGKQWSQMAKLLEKGPEQVRAMAAAIDEGHLFDDEDLQRVEDYRIAQDQLSDTWEAYAMTVGEKVIPMEIKVLSGLANTNAIRQEANRLMQEGIAHTREEALTMATATIQADLHTEALANSTEAMDAAAESAEILAVDYGKLLDGIKGMQSETDRYNETNDELNAKTIELTATQAELTDQLATLKAQGWWDESDKVQETKQKLDDVNAALEENQGDLDKNAEAHKRWAAETVLAFAQAKASADGNITEGEGQILVDIGVQLGLFDEKTAEVMENVNSAFDNVDTENAQSVIDALKKQLEQLTGEPWNITINATTSGTVANQTEPGGYATGGSFDAGMPMLVHQDEILVPDYGGVVLTRTDAMRLLSGAGGTNDNSRSIYIQSLTVVARGSVMDVLEELS